jgi:hypothetical protein
MISISVIYVPKQEQGQGQGQVQEQKSIEMLSSMTNWAVRKLKLVKRSV